MKAIENRKKGALLFMVGIALLMINSCGYAQNNHLAGQIIDTLKKFYVAYNMEWSTDKGLTLQNKIYALRETYCTNRLLKKIGHDLDYDPLVDDYHTDIAHLNTITIRKDSTKGGSYVVSYISPDYPVPIVIHLKVENEKGKFKIDAAWGVNVPKSGR